MDHNLKYPHPSFGRSWHSAEWEGQKYSCCSDVPGHSLWRKSPSQRCCSPSRTLIFTSILSILSMQVTFENTKWNLTRHHAKITYLSATIIQVTNGRKKSHILLKKSPNNWIKHHYIPAPDRVLVGNTNRLIGTSSTCKNSFHCFITPSTWKCWNTMPFGVEWDWSSSTRYVRGRRHTAGRLLLQSD